MPTLAVIQAVRAKILCHRLNKAQEAMKTAKLYGETTGQIFTEAEAGKSAEGDEASVVVPGGKTLWIVASSDKGLCGGIHSSVTKKWRKETAGLDLQDTSLVILGDKGKAQLSRLAPKSIILSFNQVGKQIPTFNDALAIAELIEDSKTEFEKVYHSTALWSRLADLSAPRSI